MIREDGTYTLTDLGRLAWRMEKMLERGERNPRRSRQGGPKPEADSGCDLVCHNGWSRDK